MRLSGPTKTLPGFGLLLLTLAVAAAGYVPGNVTPPAPYREFRGAWVASVNNIDWPSRPGLPVMQQKAELTALLDRAAQLKLNAVILQVRPACDALYASKLETWSEYLTGTNGVGPKPAYDPLEFAVTEAHRRGLELHAWFNPFRARHSTGRTALHPRHISRYSPQLVRAYGRQLWLDPGDPAARQHSLRVILDVVKRYDVDGVHLDDYFYPYPERDAAGREMDFPDAATWQRYVKSGGKLSREDWRRENVNTFVRDLYQQVKKTKRHVKVGISPFGIWRPGTPEGITGFDAFARLYADSRLWFMHGWLDYFAPQLYWPVNSPGQSFPVLLRWWAQQNQAGRHLWPGSSIYRTALRPGELTAQVNATRQGAAGSGNLLWSMKILLQNKGGTADELSRSLYAQPALVPASTWLDSQPPAAPQLAAKVKGSELRLTWDRAGSERPSLWVLQIQRGDTWTTEILPGQTDARTLRVSGAPPRYVAVRAVDRCGNLSQPAVQTWRNP